MIFSEIFEKSRLVCYHYAGRNQLGTPGGMKSFLSGAQIF